MRFRSELFSMLFTVTRVVTRVITRVVTRVISFLFVQIYYLLLINNRVCVYHLSSIQPAAPFRWRTADAHLHFRSGIFNVWEMAAPARESTLIGLCDGELDPKKHQSSYWTNKVGGRPDWLPVISRQSPRCRRCGAPLDPVVQVYCPLDTSPYHRNLHLFACSAAECSGRSECWTVLRSQCSEAEAAARTPSRPVPVQDALLSATVWCDAADDWGTEEEDGWGGGVKEDSLVQEEASGRVDHSASKHTAQN